MKIRPIICTLLGFVCLFVLMDATVVAQVENPKNGSVGMEGKISSPPPSRGATISVPSNGQTFTELPVTVRGICPDDVLVKLFKNNVFAGSVQCRGGNYSLVIDLFSGRNELVARVYDALDQAGPDSNRVTVTFNDTRPGTTPRPTLTSNFAKLGANAGNQLTWPIVLSGGSGPYAVSIDWGDGSQADLMSLSFAGPFDIKHTYKSPGAYNIIVKVTDRDGASAYLQLAGIANGQLSQDDKAAATSDAEDEDKPKTVILWQPMAIMLPLLFTTFWLGRKYQFKHLKKKVARGERPF